MINSVELERNNQIIQVYFVCPECDNEMNILQVPFICVGCDLAWKECVCSEPY